MSTTASPGARTQVFTLRVRDTHATRRIYFPEKGENSTWLDLRKKVQAEFGVPPEDQLLSKTPPHEPEYIYDAPDTITLKELGLTHGYQLYLTSLGRPSEPVKRETEEQKRAAAITAAEQHKLTPRCQHGPRARCVHCDGIAPGETPKFTNTCQHGPNATCIKCSAYVQSKDDSGPAEWLCNHPPTSFCPKCIPPDEVKDEAPKFDKIPFKRFLAERQKMCKFRHGPSSTCAMCLVPQQPSFKGKPECERGHQPWPRGVCTSCAPANAVLRPQEYRHVDTISVPQDAMRYFYEQWSRETRREVMRAAILYGRYQDEPPESGNEGAIRCIVDAFYIPPQEAGPNGVRLLNDPHENTVNEVASWLGIRPVAWVVATKERPGGPKYGGKVFMSGIEVCTAAALQEKYKPDNQEEFSKFATVILEHSAQIEPRAYQVSDQCQALVRDDCIRPSPNDPFMLQTRPLAPGELGPTIVYHDHPLENGAEFMPDNFLVKVVVMTSDPSTYLLMNHATPPPSNLDKVFIRHFLEARASEPYHLKLSDFSLLVALRLLGMNRNLLKTLCEALTLKTPLPQTLASAIDAEFLRMNLFEVGKGARR